MKTFLNCLGGVLVCVATCAGSFGQTASPAEVGADARKQASDSAFVDAERTLTLRVLDKVIAQAEADNRLLKEVNDSANLLSRRLADLKTSDDGKRIASSLDEVSAQAVQDLLSHPPGNLDTLLAIKKEIEATTADLRKLHDNPPDGFVLPEQQQDELAKDAATLQGMLAKIRERDGWLTTQVQTATPSLDLSKAPTLEAALADFKITQQRAWNEAQRKGIAQAKPEADKQVTDSAREAELEKSLQHAKELLEQTRFASEQAKIDFDMQLKTLRDQKEQEVADLNRSLAEAEAKRAVANAKSDVIRHEGVTEAEKLRLIEKCKDPQVMQILAPFTDTGLWQPGDQPGRPWLHERGPISFKAIQATGALKKTEKGLSLLHALGNVTSFYWPHGGHHPDTERSKWGYAVPPKLTQQDWGEIQKAQDLLNELGPTMVEQKIFAP